MAVVQITSGSGTKIHCDLTGAADDEYAQVVKLGLGVGPTNADAILLGTGRQAKTSSLPVTLASDEVATAAQSNTQGNPAASLLQSLNVTAADNTVKVALSIPEALVEQFAPQRRPVQARRQPQTLLK